MFTLPITISRVANKRMRKRVFPSSDAASFQRSKPRLKKYRLKRKQQWVEDATRIHEALLGNLSVEAENVLDFFDGTE